MWMWIGFVVSARWLTMVVPAGCWLLAADWQVGSDAGRVQVVQCTSYLGTRYGRCGTFTTVYQYGVTGSLQVPIDGCQCAGAVCKAGEAGEATTR
ncbi:hypothetical protein BO70DRAFT_32111 [Aspergillus heteromorphus CBS 117.55]|uniref:Uncharacterized protein n=1 Tax=Aspergillus heteromorphus CBS 117.55 TaxID=1448321 RepID=A0A317WCK3_9EURO|nr:uncharacterized protein BO70DRAFT_32111 [Aspergillus heteromorphus CBS 117.55]PWY82932.1 hypothetical protein BO70DRAFT_32111 [Aspergillus heteromorphus CBS 117.55]